MARYQSHFHDNASGVLVTTNLVYNRTYSISHLYIRSRLYRHVASSFTYQFQYYSNEVNDSVGSLKYIAVCEKEK